MKYWRIVIFAFFEKSAEILNCAVMLARGYIQLATDYAVSCGGGGEVQLLDGDVIKMMMMIDGGGSVWLTLLQWYALQKEAQSW